MTDFQPISSKMNLIIQLADVVSRMQDFTFYHNNHLYEPVASLQLYQLVELEQPSHPNLDLEIQIPWSSEHYKHQKRVEEYRDPFRI